MDNYYIIANGIKDPHLAVTEKIAEYLKKHGKTCRVQKEGGRKEQSSYRYTDPGLIPDEVQCIIVLGGDGTLLQAARDVVHKNIPLFGINMGTLGYLAEIDKYSIFPALDQLMQDDYELEERMMFRGKVYQKGTLIGEDIALNDIVISRERPLGVLKFVNYVNYEYLNTYQADGIIISTPTGSTGYSLSAGGPIVSPSAFLTVMTPLAPHTINARSIIFPEQDVITVEIGEGRIEPVRGLAVFDGDTAIPMSRGDKIVIEKAEERTKIVKLNRLSFVEVLRQKMQNS